MAKRVEYDINKSMYVFKVDNLIFYFSSAFNLLRFHDRYPDYIEEETNKLQAKYHVYLDIKKYLLIAFYKKIEKRGFKVLTYQNNGIIELKEDYIFKIS